MFSQAVPPVQSLKSSRSKAVSHRGSVIEWSFAWMIALLLAGSLIPCATVSAQSAGTPESGLPLHGDQADQFLRTAEVIEIDKRFWGVNSGFAMVVLSDGDRTHRAAFKFGDYSSSKPVRRSSSGRLVFGVSRSYKNDIAAYEVDKLLGLGIVPPCVERSIDAQTGSLHLWIENSMSEWERATVEKIQPPDRQAWNRQIHTIRLFLQLINVIDHSANDLVIDSNWRIYNVASTVAFGPDKKLAPNPELTLFSRSVLEALSQLDIQELETNLRPWLSKRQIKSLVSRRGEILELAERRIAEQGEAAVLFP